MGEAQFLEIASAISDGGFAPKPRRGIRSRRFIDALSVRIDFGLRGFVATNPREKGTSRLNAGEPWG